MKKILILTALCFCFFSCKKKHTLKVTVTNVGTGKPMPNNGVYITELTNKVEGLGGGTITHDFYSGTTNENGELFITKKFDTRYTYEVSVDLPDNWAYVENVSYTMAPKDKYWNNGIDFKIATAAYLKLSIHNVNCQGSGDIITVDMQPIYVSDYDNFQPLTKDSCYDNDFIESKVPSGNWEATWQVTKSGITTNYDTTFFIPGDGHYHLTINY